MIFLIIFLFILLFIVAKSLYNGVAPLPTSPKVARKLVECLSESIHQPILELGSGFGTLLLFLSKKLPHHKIIGYENSLFPYLFSLCIIKIFGCKNVEIYKRNFYSISLKNSGAIVCYLYPGAMKKLKHKFQNELNPGIWIFSHTFALPDMTPIFVEKASDLYKTKIYIYNSSDMIKV